MYERLAFASTGDTILLIEDGVLALNSRLALGSFIAKCSANKVRLSALAEDCQIRGVVNQYPEVELIDYLTFVDLVTTHNRQVSW